MGRVALLASVLLLACEGTRVAVREHNSAQALQKNAARQRQMIVLMYDGNCATTKAFQPWLFALAQFMPHLLISRVDVSRENGMLKSVFQLSKTPQIKAFIRDNPKGKKIINYKGQLEFESLLGWLQAIHNGVSHPLSEFGVEPPESTALRGTVRGGDVDPMGHLPESVRAMATTMARENRLQRLLKEQGGGRLEHYNNKVSRRFVEIMKSEDIDRTDKFGVQDANRRARDEVREEVLDSAPQHIRDEVEGDVRLGDVAAKQAEAL
uniref:Thioredoxin domain-containing protein n=1 Tax=Haptolina brevifila TaxID=156173 RepID=A0A7S2MUZ0_9EUKA|mmetsp:Transcript_59361/g.117929  ORF Transcript_59361/g.117929 Transcript_59361/m.117929 type:complete len:266 (+) Transcript_59361:3-800(+)